MKKYPKQKSTLSWLRLRKPYAVENFHITSDELIVRKDVYKLRKIKQLEVRKLGVKENAINVLSLAFMLSAATWAFVPQFGFLMLALTSILAFVSWRRYELRAEFVGTDESGDQWVSIVRACTDDEFQALQQIEAQLLSKV